MMRWFFVLVVLFACSSRDSAPSNIFPTVPEYTERTAPVCDPLTIDQDTNHCGSCDSPCSPDDADRCIMGICQCGPGGTCSAGSDCRSGACIPRDFEGSPCEFDEQCSANDACIEGNCSFVECVPEVCDGIDNDCDGHVDEIGNSDELSPLAEYCFSGAAAPDSVLSPCQQGVRVCLAGTWGECIGEIAPVSEAGLFGCDGRDNDCDGCVDGVFVDGHCESAAASGFDVLFLIDTSGSMANKISIVRESVRLFSVRLSGSSAFRWGIVTIPDIRRPIVYPEMPGLHQDLTDFATFETSLAGTLTGGGDEPQWDAVAMSLDGTLGVSWRPDSTKIMILFTDEVGEGSDHSNVIRDEAEMCTHVDSSGAVLISAVTIPEDFDDCANALIDLPRAGTAGSGGGCAGDSYCSEGDVCEASRCVSEAVVEMANSLNAVISDPCEAL